jgi:chromatin segregation and condensation protein Rec8/ScpA/Scc1 (kleisin family)
VKVEELDLSEKINKRIALIKDDVLSGKINLLELQLNPIFSEIKNSISIHNIENYSQSYKNAVELLNDKFEELKNLLSSLDIEKKFEDFLKTHPNEDQISDIFRGCWRETFHFEPISLKFLDYASNRYIRERKTHYTIEHLTREKTNDQFLLEVPKYKYTEKISAFYDKIKKKLPCFFEDVFDNELDQIEIYEQFVYLLHLLQLGKIKYQKDTNTLYI